MRPPTDRQSVARSTAGSRPRIVVGFTLAQTCLNLQGHLVALRQAGFAVTLVSSPGPLLEQTARRDGVDFAAVAMRRRIAPFSDLVSLCRMVWLLFRLRPEMVEFSTPKAGLLGTLAAWIVRTPVRVYRLRGLKLERSHGWRYRLLLGTERLAAACAHVVLCNSASLAAEARALNIAPSHKLRLLGSGSSNGVDLARFFPGPSPVRARLGISGDDLVVGFAGRLTRDKGLPELVEAFEGIHAAEPRARLLLVGWFDTAEDALDPGLAEHIGRDPRIHVTGFVDDTAPYYRAMDLMVLPTWREGFPGAVLEAAATELPVVTTLATGSRDAVLAEVTGLLIPPGSPEAIRETVLRLLAQPERRRRMGRAARAWVAEHFETGQVLARTCELYLDLLAQAGHGPSVRLRKEQPQVSRLRS